MKKSKRQLDFEAREKMQQTIHVEVSRTQS